MLAWLSLWGEVQICIWPSWCYCHSLSLAAVNPDWFYLSGTGWMGCPRQSPGVCKMVVVVVVAVVSVYLHFLLWIASHFVVRTAFLLYSVFTELSYYQQSKGVSTVFQQMPTSIYDGSFSLVCYPLSIFVFSFLEYVFNVNCWKKTEICLHCFDTVGWAAGRASGL